jgi:hypothetical protein
MEQTTVKRISENRERDVEPGVSEGDGVEEEMIKEEAIGKEPITWKKERRGFRTTNGDS